MVNEGFVPLITLIVRLQDFLVFEVGKFQFIVLRFKGNGEIVLLSLLHLGCLLLLRRLLRCKGCRVVVSGRMDTWTLRISFSKREGLC